MAPSSYLNVLFIFLLFLTTLSARTISNTNNHKGFTVELLRRGSPRSPSYNPTSAWSESVREAAHSSISRFRYFSQRILSTNGSIESEVGPLGGGFYMKLAIGTPPVEFIATLDTGSDLIWTQCDPCENCFQQPTPLFDSDKSSTYQSLGCNSNFCNDFPQGRRSCDARRQCNYYYSYGDQSFTRGVMASETLTFDSNSGDKVKIPAIGFGCGHNNQGTFSGTAGLVGLGRGPLSLVSQLGSSVGNKFSYCFVPRDSQNSSSLLKFGDDAEFAGSGDVQQTPLVQMPGQLQSFYYLTVNDISVGNKKLNIPTGSLTPSTEGGGFIIDSGTTLTFLASDVYDVVKSALRDVITLPEAEAPSPFDLCYSIDQSSDFSGLPNVTFHFDGDADWPLPPTNYLVDLTDNGQAILCSVIVPSNGLSIFGNIMQQNVYVEYDLGNNALSFASTDCTSN